MPAESFAEIGGCRADSAMNPAILPIIIMDVFNQLAPEDKDYFRASREQRFGKPLEQVGMKAPDIAASCL